LFASDPSANAKRPECRQTNKRNRWSFCRLRNDNDNGAKFIFPKGTVEALNFPNPTKYVHTGRVCKGIFFLFFRVPPPRRKGDLKLLSLIGENIRVERKRRHLTQEALAELLDLYPRAYQRIEAGTAGPSVATLVRIKAALGCSWDELMAGIKWPP
jgi:DNA-binding XRE family transcriptional regulator